MKADEAVKAGATLLTASISLWISITSHLHGLGPQTVGLPVAFLAPVAVILPVNMIPNIVFHSAGYFNQKQMIAYGLVVSLVSTILILLVGLPYGRLTGLI